MSWKLDNIAKFIRAIATGKRILWIHPKWVVMDYSSWTDLNTKKHKEAHVAVVWDEVANYSGHEWDRLSALLLGRKKDAP